MEPKWLPNSLGGRFGGFQEPSQKSFKNCVENCRFWGALGTPSGHLFGNILEPVWRLFADPVLRGVLEAFWEGFGVDFGVDFGRILGDYFGIFVNMICTFFLFLAPHPRL